MAYPGDTYNTYIGIGKVHARAYGASTALRHVGNVSKLNIKYSLDSIRQRDYTRAGGATMARVDRISQIETELTLESFNLENWKLATVGTSSNTATGTVTDEAVTAYRDSLCRLANPPSAITSVKHTSGSPTYVAGTDYDISAAGIWIYGTGAITDAQALKVTYTKQTYDTIEAGTSANTALETVFEGLNEANSNKPVIVEFWRMLVPPASTIELIGEKMGQFEFTTELLKDPSKVSNVSAYYRVRYIN